MSRRLEGITDLRGYTARGTVINAAFQVGLTGLSFARRFFIAAFLTATEFGIWGAMLTTLFLVLFVKSIGTVDKFVQQDEHDQRAAFQKAFTIDLLLSVAALALAAAILPVFAVLYGKTEIIAPGLLLSLTLLGNTLQAPKWIYYRRMQFVRQRVLDAIDPVVAFAVTLALAIAGFGFWSLVIGAVVGSFAAGVVAVAVSPYPLGIRFERATLREYYSFSWPLVIANGSALLTAQVTMIIAARTMGIAEVGVIALAVAITAFTGGVHRIITRSLYPAICAVRDRLDVLEEAFVKSNRLTLMWGVPFGVALALFASDLVEFAFGPTWTDAAIVLQGFGIAAALQQVCFNWASFMRALNRTKPLAAIAILQLMAYGVITVPLLLAAGLEGFAVAAVATQLVSLAGRAYVIATVFTGFDFLRHASRGAAPVLPAVAAVLVARLAEVGERTPTVAIGELMVFVAVTIGATAIVERTLLREVVDLLRRGGRMAVPAAS